ncbi:amidase [Nocardia sp. 348MFTsu5.1]|uniref:amidase n=1 Tax=Nocardia sp. 348MFTsu5.1 TaxID=1172185 RepID=UPI00055C8CB6|nr:amidase [Nocardia sp. 348MFTsu5.1]
MRQNSTLRGLGATDLQVRYSSGDLSPIDVTAETLDAIEGLNPSINAFTQVWADSAGRDAELSAQRHRRRTPLGPLDGVPVTIKDLLLTAGRPTLRGSELINPDQPWPEDSPAVARLREAGAVILGKVTTPEFGWKGVTDSPSCGITRNPWNLERTSGGSSGGSAAAVAAGLSVLSVGTDGGGSIRIPAAFCGIVGFKPTYGRVPIYPASPFGTLAHVGPLGRSVADVAAMLDVISGFDVRDWSALDATEPIDLSSESLDGLRIAFSPNLGFGTNNPDVERGVRSTLDVFSGLGATVEEIDLSLEDPVWAYHVLWFSGAAVVVAAYGDGAEAKVDPSLVQALSRHSNYSAGDYIDATTVRMDLGRKMGLLHQDYDVLITPAMPDVAFAAGLDVPPGSRDPDWTSWTPYTYPFNLTQQPAITVPCGFVDGLPIGVQIVGPRHGDQRVLQVASAFEKNWGGGSERE